MYELANVYKLAEKINFNNLQLKSISYENTDANQPENLASALLSVSATSIAITNSTLSNLRTTHPTFIYFNAESITIADVTIQQTNITLSSSLLQTYHAMKVVC